MNSIDTDIGKIFCRYNKSSDDFTMMRLCKIQKNEDSKPTYFFRYMDKNFKILNSEDSNDGKIVGECMGEKEFLNIKKNWTLLKSDGIISLTNIVSVANEERKIKDVLAIYFPNNETTQVPDVTQPYIVARQGIDNIFASMEGINSAGMSVSLDTLPAGYALSDFMENTEVLDSHLCHVYKTDTEYNLSILLDNDNSNEILKDLYDHAVRFNMNTIDGYKERKDIKDDCVNGYCNSIKSFLDKTEFMLELYNKLGITKVDFKITEAEKINDEDRLYLSALYGGIRIQKAIPLKFDYTINTKLFKMKYLMVIDILDILYIIPYTEFPDEMTSDEIYNLTEDRTIKLQERLSKCVKAYDNFNNKKDAKYSDLKS